MRSTRDSLFDLTGRIRTPGVSERGGEGGSRAPCSLKIPNFCGRIRSMQKQCARCKVTKPLDSFCRRSLSKDGYAPSCRECLNAAKRATYQASPAERAATSARVTENRARRFKEDPAYKRAFNLWGSTKKRATKIPPWVSITDFVPICAEAVRRGKGWTIDHVIPISHPLVCGLHVPSNLCVIPEGLNQMKGSRFTLDL